MKLFEKIIEFLFMLQIFICPVGIFSIIGFVLQYAIDLPKNYFIALLILGSLLGVVFIKYAINTSGSCAQFMARVFRF
jgi:hypothetical protein